MNLQKSSKNMAGDLIFIENFLDRGLDFTSRKGIDEIKNLIDYMKKSILGKQSLITQQMADIDDIRNAKADVEHQLQ